MTLGSVCGGKVGVSMLGAFDLLCPISSFKLLIMPAIRCYIRILQITAVLE